MRDGIQRESARGQGKSRRHENREKKHGRNARGERSCAWRQDEDRQNGSRKIRKRAGGGRC